MIQDIGFFLCFLLLIGFGAAIPWAVRNDNAGELYDYPRYEHEDPTLTERNAA